MRTRAFTLRVAALMGVGSLAVHQLRFLLWYGHASDSALGAQGHAYLAVLGPLVVAATVLAVAHLLGHLAGGADTGGPRFWPLWAGLSGSLVAIYSLQESLEGLLSTEHPGGVDGVLGHGGWLSVALAIAVGLALALALRGASRASELLRQRRSLRPPLPAAPTSLHASASFLQLREPCLATPSARAPPAASA